MPSTHRLVINQSLTTNDCAGGNKSVMKPDNVISVAAV